MNRGDRFASTPALLERDRLFEILLGLAMILQLLQMK